MKLGDDVGEAKRGGSRGFDCSLDLKIRAIVPDQALTLLSFEWEFGWEESQTSELFDGFALSISVVSSKDEANLAGRGIDRYPLKLERVSSDTSINRDWLDCFRSRYSIFVTYSPYLIYLGARWITDDVCL